MAYNTNSVVAKVFKMCVDGNMVREVAYELLKQLEVRK